MKVVWTQESSWDCLGPRSGEWGKGRASQVMGKRWDRVESSALGGPGTFSETGHVQFPSVQGRGTLGLHRHSKLYPGHLPPAFCECREAGLAPS